MQSSGSNDHHDVNSHPSETTPLVSRRATAQEPKRLNLSYTEDRSSSMPRPSLTFQPHRNDEQPDVLGAAEDPSNEPSPSNQSASTLVSCSDQDASSAWQSCKPPQSGSLGSFSPLRQLYESLKPSISLTLENHGSVARDHLASERTFLAYVRTSLAIASSGVVLVQLFTTSSSNFPHSPEHRLLTYIRPLGAGTISMGLMVLLIGVVRYFSIQAALTKGYFPAARAVTGLITLILVILVIVTFAILLVGRPELPRD